MKPARMLSAEKYYNELSSEESKKGIALVSLDYSPSTNAENGSQAKLTIEHLLRKRIPFALVSFLPESKVLIDSIVPEVIKILEEENPEEKWDYGKDWVTLGFRPQLVMFLKGLSKTEDIAGYFGQDNFGTPVKQFELFKNVKSIKDISVLAEFTGSNILAAYIQFFRAENYAPRILHGTTAVSVPEAYIYLDSRQIIGLLEGLGGAAWYEQLLNEEYKKRTNKNANILNTSLGISQITVILLIIAGNFVYFLGKRKQA